MWKKGQNRVNVNDHKHGLLTFNGDIYNENDDGHKCKMFAQTPTTKRAKSKVGNSAITDSGCTRTFMA